MAERMPEKMCCDNPERCKRNRDGKAHAEECGKSFSIAQAILAGDDRGKHPGYQRQGGRNGKREQAVGAVGSGLQHAGQEWQQQKGNKGCGDIAAQVPQPVTHMSGAGKMLKKREASAHVWPQKGVYIDMHSEYPVHHKPIHG